MTDVVGGAFFPELSQADLWGVIVPSLRFF